MHLALYRAERPERFEEIIGQKHIVKILRNQLAKGKINQAYLFTGTRGTGKTSTARILAKAMNCTGTDDPLKKPCCECDNCEAIREGRFLDVIELDAASNNGVEDIRSIIESVQYPPTVGSYKIYIIDEVHMLSPSAENAFLKTLEEPPEYAVFILATTNPEKVRDTIRSRCMTLNFKRVSENDLISGMERISLKNGVAVDDEALHLIASRSDGSVRDSLSILEQCISGGDEHVDKNMVLEYIGAAGQDFYTGLTYSVMTGDIGSAFEKIDRAIREGKDARQLLNDWLGHFRDLMIVKYAGSAAGIIGSSDENVERLKELAGKMSDETLSRSIKLLSEYVNMARYSTMPRLLIETAVVELAGVRKAAKSKGRAIEPASEQVEKFGAKAPEKAEPEFPQKDKSVIIEKDYTDFPEDTSEPVEDDAQESMPISRSEYVTTLTPEPLSDRMIEAGAAIESDADLEEVWLSMMGELSSTDPSFESVVAKNSKVTSMADGEIVLTVKKNKIGIAEASFEEITRVAKRLFGNEIYVTLKAGNAKDDYSHSKTSGVEHRADRFEQGGFAEEEAETDRAAIDEMKDDIEKLLGVEVRITD